MAGFVVLVVVVSDGVSPGSVDFTLAANTKLVFVPTMLGFVVVLAGVVAAVVLDCPLNCPVKLNPVVLCPSAKPRTGCVAACVLAGVVPNVKPEVACAAGFPPAFNVG
jgi:hypothetical protein